MLPGDFAIPWGQPPPNANTSNAARRAEDRRSRMFSPRKMFKALSPQQEMRVYSLADQLGFSLASFVLTLVFIRCYSKEEFAAYGIGLFAALSLAGMYRVSFAIPAALWNPQIFTLRQRAVPALHLSVVLTVLVLAVAALFFLTQAVKGSTVYIALGFIATTTTYLSLDIDRVLLFRTRKPSQALAVSGSYSVIIMLASGCFFLLRPPFTLAMVVLSVLGLCKTTAVALLSGGPDWRHGRLLFQRLIRTTFGWNTLGNLASTSFLIVPQWVLGIISTPNEVAGFTAVRTPMQPVMVIIRSLDVVDKVTSGKLNQRDSSDAIKQHYRRVYWLYVTISMIFCAAILIFADPVVNFVLGARYSGFVWTLRVTAILLMFTATAAPLETVVYQQMAYRSYAIAQLIGGAVGAACAFPLAKEFGASGAVTASILGWGVPYTYLLRKFAAATRKS